MGERRLQFLYTANDLPSPKRHPELHQLGTSQVGLIEKEDNAPTALVLSFSQDQTACERFAKTLRSARC